MTVAELIQELLNVEPSHEVTILNDTTGEYEPIHTWDYIYPTFERAGPIESIVLWPRD